MLWVVCTLIVVISTAHADTLCPPDVCTRVLCAPVNADTCKGVVKPHASECGCCDACAAEVGPCAKKLAEVNARLQADTEHMLLGLEAPLCDTDGYYTGMQKRGSQAFCVTKNGTMIDGYSVYRWMTGDDMNCICARDQYEYRQTGLRGKIFNCEQNGNYAPYGCLGSVCYCQDKYGKQVGTSTVHIGQQDSLNC